LKNYIDAVIMTEQQQKTKCITLKGSAELVKQYLCKCSYLFKLNYIYALNINVYELCCITVYGINNILYQRGIYPPETFEPAEHFGLCILMSTDPQIVNFFNVVLSQIQEWLIQKKVRKVTMVISNVNTKEVLEKWDFKVDYETEMSNGKGDGNSSEIGTKDIKTIQKEIREVIRQITGRSICFFILLLSIFKIYKYFIYNYIYNCFRNCQLFTSS
jgi:mitotic spindle assembly checkpoint protein MAD2